MTLDSSAVTVLVTTSPTPSHPSDAMLRETLSSLDGTGLGQCEALVLCDGVHPSLEHRAEAYAEYLRRVGLFALDTSCVLPMLFVRHLYQAGMVAVALRMVETPLILFLEHDTPLVGDVPWGELAAMVLSGDAHLIRLHHEASIPDEHKHLMLDAEPTLWNGTLPVLRTVQWSQRPHLASTAFYRRMLTNYFPPVASTMIEDVMHSVVQVAWDTEGEAGWARFGMWIYHPEGSIKRSTHLDGRGEDPKPPMTFR